MNTEALFLFLILLLGLVLCSFLGGNCGNEGFTGNIEGTITTISNHNNVNKSNDNIENKSNDNIDDKSNDDIDNKSMNNMYSTSYDNYNHFNGASAKLAVGNKFYGQNGGFVVVDTDSNGEQSLKITFKHGDQPITFFSPKQVSSSRNDSFTNYTYNNGTSPTFYGPNGATANIVNSDKGQQSINAKTSSGSYVYTQSGSYYNPDNISSTQYYGSTGTPIQSSDYNLAYSRPNNGPISGSQCNTVARTNLQGTSLQGTNLQGTSGAPDYYDSLPTGIQGNQIPPGKEDLYILKSQVVPPVCPVCPVGAACPRQEKCPPCPACARCPEPSFECKKVPNYNAVGNSFSPFGM